MRLRHCMFGVPAIGLFHLLLLGCQAEVDEPFLRGSGDVVTEQREVSGFSTIQLDGVGNVAVKQTGGESLSVTADDNLLPLLGTEVEDGILHLSVSGDGNIVPSQAIVFEIEVRTLEGLSINGAGTTRISDLRGKKLAVTIQGTGHVAIEGEVEALEVNVSGSGNFQGGQLKAKRAEVWLGGTGNVMLQASETLNVDLSGTGMVTYFGDPKLTESISGTGRITKR